MTDVGTDIEYPIPRFHLLAELGVFGLVGLEGALADLPPEVDPLQLLLKPMGKAARRPLE